MSSAIKRYTEQKGLNKRYYNALNRNAIDNYISARESQNNGADAKEINSIVNTIAEEIVKGVEKAIKK